MAHRIGDCELLAELAAGGMATVYVARQLAATGIERLVVVKRVHPHLLELPSFREMFHDEARLASVVTHPNVVRLLDVIDADGELLLVLEYVESVSLSSLLRASGALPPAVCARIVCDVLAGLHAAHEAADARGKRLEIVHRDVSPQNVIIGVDGASHLIDFGIAKAATRLTETTAGALKGKLGYMSPEQAKGASPIDRRSDLFSCGIVLFEALTGTRLFGHEDGPHVLLKILLDPIPAPSSLAPDVPPALDRLVERALERPRDERFQTAAEFKEALEAAIAPSPTSAVADVVERHAGAAIRARRAHLQRILDGLDAPVALAPKVPRLDAPPPRRGRTALLVAAGVLAAAGALAATRFASRGARATPPEPKVTVASAAATDATPTASAAPPPAPPPVTSAAPDPAPTPPHRAPRARPRPVASPAPTSPAPPAPAPDLHQENPY